MNRQSASIVIAASLLLPAAAIAQGRYDELLRSDAHNTTLRSVGLLILALPHERENVYPQIAELFWTRFPDHQLRAAAVELESNRLARQVDEVQRIVEKYDLRELSFVGFSEVLTLYNLDLYYSADTPHGPVVFRVSIHMPEEPPIRLFEISSWEGWEETRAIAREIQHRPGRGYVRVRYSPDKLEPDAMEEE